MPDAIDASVKKIVAKGKKRGFLTYEELNEDLPDEAVSPEQIDSLLMTLDELAIELIDEIEAARRRPFVAAEGDKTKATRARSQEELDAARKRIDDPVRMYLTQMGEIPLLSRPEEIALAKKIEMTRMHFRRRVLESDYCVQQARDILVQVQNGDLPFDRTMKISTAENLSKETITARMPANLGTVAKVIDANRLDWRKVRTDRSSEREAHHLRRNLWRRRRRASSPGWGSPSPCC